MTTLLPYRVRYSSGRDICIKCRSFIQKGVVQIAIMEQSMTDDCIEPLWYEEDCFFQVRRPSNETLIDGLANLRHTHQMKIRQRLGFSVNVPGTVNPHRSTVEIDREQPAEKTCNVGADLMLERQIKQQNKEFFEIRGILKFNTKKDDRVAILEANNQFVPEGNSEILNHVTDVIYFGAMIPCSVCKSGKFVLKNSIYCCTGTLSEWSKCVNTVTEPKRLPIKIPDKYKKFLRRNFEIHSRILKPVPQMSDEDFELHVKQPLFDMEFFIVGETTKCEEDIEKKIKQMGGKVTKEIHENLAAVISNVDEINQMGMAMEMARKYGIHVVPEKLIDEVKNTDPIDFITKNDLSGWGKDLYKRLPQKSNAVVNLVGLGTSSDISKFQHMKLKHGGVVDPESKLANIAHVYTIGELQYCVILGLVDIGANKNSYFKMQLLESDSMPMYWLFESKGRIATTIGTVSVKPFENFGDADEAFKKSYREKTGNEFGTEFVKKPGKYNQMKVGNEKLPKSLKVDNVEDCNTLPSRLSIPLFRLLKLLFDIKQMESALLGFDLDLGKMPLGKINRCQTVSAMILLIEISSLLKQKHQSSNEIMAASNQFYSQIPHNFGLRRPPVINTREMIKKKYEMLDAMQKMEIFYHILSEGTDEKVNLIDAYYDRIKDSVEITLLRQATEEYAEISDYVKNTQLIPEANPIAQEFRLVEVFKVSRNDEIERFRRFEGTANRQLLWHGTRLTNMVGILKSGLKIAPNQVRMSGRYFGPGIYFSDSLTKSVGYCRVLNPDLSVLLLLCEVALGHPQLDRQPADSNCDSVKGSGRYYPHPIHVRADGLIVPNGNLVRSDIQRRLTFNEFVVYNESRVKIRYIVKLRL